MNSPRSVVEISSRKDPRFRDLRKEVCELNGIRLVVEISSREDPKLRDLRIQSQIDESRSWVVSIVVLIRNRRSSFLESVLKDSGIETVSRYKESIVLQYSFSLSLGNRVLAFKSPIGGAIPRMGPITHSPETPRKSAFHELHEEPDETPLFLL